MPKAPKDTVAMKLIVGVVASEDSLFKTGDVYIVHDIQDGEQRGYKALSLRPSWVNPPAEGEKPKHLATLYAANQEVLQALIVTERFGFRTIFRRNT